MHRAGARRAGIAPEGSAQTQPHGGHLTQQAESSQTRRALRAARRQAIDRIAVHWLRVLRVLLPSRPRQSLPPSLARRTRLSTDSDPLRSVVSNLKFICHLVRPDWIGAEHAWTTASFPTRSIPQSLTDGRAQAKTFREARSKSSRLPGGPPLRLRHAVEPQWWHTGHSSVATPPAHHLALAALKM